MSTRLDLDPVPGCGDGRDDGRHADLAELVDGHYPFRPCTPVALPDHLVVDAARTACEANPANVPHPQALAALDRALPGVLARVGTPFHLALMTGKNFAPGTVLTVGFLESTPADLADRILQHMSAWTDGGVNIRFVRSATSPQIRITRSGDGYWSYIGTDVLSIPDGQPTMSLQEFTMNTPESEYRRVVRHETGHSLGFPHEHSRREIVALLDPNRTISYFEATQGWTAAMIREQILTPLDERSVMGTPHAEQDSIMCYQFPGACTVSGRPVVGGADITPDDYAFAGGVYPGLKPTKPPAGTDRIHGYVAINAQKAVRKLVVYVPDGGGKGGELGFQYDGAFVASRDNEQVLMFDGPGKRVSVN